MRRHEGGGADAKAGDTGGDQGRSETGRHGAGAAVSLVGDAGVEAALGFHLPAGRMEGMSEDGDDRAGEAPSPRPPPAGGGGDRQAPLLPPPLRAGVGGGGGGALRRPRAIP